MGSIEKEKVPTPFPPHATRFEEIATAGGPVVLCNPTRAQFRMFRAASLNTGASDPGQGYENLFLATWCGDPGAAMKMLDEWPGVVMAPDVVAAMNRLAGITNEAAVKT